MCYAVRLPGRLALVFASASCVIGGAQMGAGRGVMGSLTDTAAHADDLQRRNLRMEEHAVYTNLSAWTLFPFGIRQDETSGFRFTRVFDTHRNGRSNHCGGLS